MAILTVIWEKWIEFKHEWIKITISSLITPLLYLITFGLGIGNFITTGDRPYLQFFNSRYYCSYHYEFQL